MLQIPPAVAPLVWCLGFVLVVAAVYALITWLEITLHPKLVQIMIFLVCLIVAVVLLLWLLGFLGIMKPLAHGFLGLGPVLG